ncbi:FHA domain-containing protein, partial [Cryobacterium algoricola]
PAAPAAPAAPLSPAPAVAAPLSRADLVGVSDDTGHDGVVTAEEGAAADVDDMEATRISARRAKPWTFETETGAQVSLTGPVVYLGRNPSGSGEYPDAQLVAVIDTGKTVSKSHARIELSNGVWSITDLHSTNGIVLIDDGGDERELVAGASALLTERFLLGELPARIFLET